MSNTLDTTVTGTNPADPLEALLEQAFAAELAQPVDEAAIARITARIAFEQKLRGIVMLILVVIGAVLGVSVLLPAVAAMFSALPMPALDSVATLANTGGYGPMPVVAGLLMLLLSPWLIDLVDDRV